MDQLEWGDHLIAHSRQGITNPAGFYVHLITEKITPPEDFETSRKRKVREAQNQEIQAERQRYYALEETYKNYRAQMVNEHMGTLLRPEDIQRLITVHLERRRKDDWSKNLPLQTLREIAERDMRQEIAESLPLLSFDAFCEQEGQKPPVSEV
jgi:hypothetical protein